ncbi:MAG: hypothetical protein BWX61_00251 [Bacteroidetes bacterium ADurb.Bin035]|nr:MAG: hypothetical protein BWX61_00251 [Bacteroidetes bacterium ADurb.Bin035]
MIKSSDTLILLKSESLVIVFHTSLLFNKLISSFVNTSFFLFIKFLIEATYNLNPVILP